jgi:hypothetical protein
MGTHARILTGFDILYQHPGTDSDDWDIPGLALPEERIARVALKPFMTGISISIRIMLYE